MQLFMVMKTVDNNVLNKHTLFNVYNKKVQNHLLSSVSNSQNVEKKTREIYKKVKKHEVRWKPRTAFS